MFRNTTSYVSSIALTGCFFRLWATIICIGLACLVTAQVLAVRKMGFNVNAYLLNTFVGVTLTLSGATYQILYSDELLYNKFFCSNTYYTALIVVVSSIMASFISPLEALALQRTKAAVYTSIGTSKVVLDYGIQLVFFPDEGLSWTTVLGAIVVTITALDLSLNLDVLVMKWFKERKLEMIQKEVDKSVETNDTNMGIAAESNC